MKEELEPVLRAQITALKSQIDLLKGMIIDTEENTARLKNVIANDLVEALVKRFQDNEKKIENMHSQVISLHTDIQNQLLEVKKLRERQISDQALQKAIARLVEEEIKVDSEPLYELRE